MSTGQVIPLPTKRKNNVVVTNEQKQKPHIRPRKYGRNEPCPCGSGRKVKRCHGQLL